MLYDAYNKVSPAFNIFLKNTSTRLLIQIQILDPYRTGYSNDKSNNQSHKWLKHEVDKILNKPWKAWRKITELGWLEWSWINESIVTNAEVRDCHIPLFDRGLETVWIST